jgi:lipopolysaccharide/colanic/teichoic acid biosynthesis glycosyltransferase
MKRIALLAFDLLLVAGATILALLLRDNFEFSEAHLRDLIPYLSITVACAAIAFSISGISWSAWRASALHDCIAIAVSSVATVLGAVAISFLLNRLEGVPRAVPVLTLMNIIFALVAVRVLFRLSHDRRARPPQFSAASLATPPKTVLLVGTTRIAELYLRSAEELGSDSVAIAGIVTRKAPKVGRSIDGHRVIGSLDEIGDVLKRLEVHGVRLDEIAVAIPYRKLTAHEQQQLGALELTTGIRLSYIADAMLGSVEPADQRNLLPDRDEDLTFDLRGEKLFSLKDRTFWIAKRAFDVTMAALLLVIFAPLIAVVGLLAALDVGAPIVFWQQRPGVGGRPFRLYKVRTMIAAHDSNGQRRSDEQRSSVIGKFLRRTRLDELPQLYNILVGDMSFVGPRPLLPSDQPIGSSVRTLIRPGLTGWAQINGGRHVSPADKAALDIWYIQNATVFLDIRIFAATALMLLLGERLNDRAIELAWEDLCASGVCKGIASADGLRPDAAAQNRVSAVRAA